MAPALLGHWRVIALLTILIAGLLLGRSARRITPLMELALFLIVASVVLGQFLAWDTGTDLDVRQLLVDATRWTR